MAFIGSNIPGGGGLQPTFNRPAFGPGLNGLSGAAGTPAGPAGNLGYGRQALGDVDQIMALLIKLLLQNANGGSQPSSGQCGGMDPSSLQTAGGKGGGGRALRRAGGKGAGRAPSLPQAPAKAAPSLKMAGGKAR